MSRIKVSLINVALFCGAMPCLQAQVGHQAEVWLTSADRVSLLAQQPHPVIFTKTSTAAATIEVTDTRLQQMDGFGYALTDGSAELLMRMHPNERKTLLRELFSSRNQGIGVSYIRLSIGSSDMNEHVFTYDDLPAGQEDVDLAHFNLGPDHADVIPVVKEILAINPEISILASPWSAPSWMKTNDNPKAGNLRLDRYSIYANYFVKYIEAMRSEGIAITAITVQNEPLNPKNTPSMVMSAKEEGDFIGSALGPALRAAGLTTKIILYDHNCDRPDYPLAILDDAKANEFVAGSGFHLYGGTIDAMTKVHDAHPEKNLYFTEQMVTQEDNAKPFRISESVSRVVLGATNNWSRNVLLWNLAADPHDGPHTDSGGCPICQGAITLDGDSVSRNLAFYTIAHIAKFVPPGSFHLESPETTEGSLPHASFITPDHKKVLLVANPGKEPKTFQVRYHQTQFTASLNAGDVATYVWQ